MTWENEDAFDFELFMNSSPYRPRYFDMDGNEIGMLEWATLFEKGNDRHIGNAYILVPGVLKHAPDWLRWILSEAGILKFKKLHVSTVWLGLNHQFGDGPPLIFETMVFDVDTDDRWNDKLQWRYSTKKEALEGHKLALELVRLNA